MKLISFICLLFSFSIAAQSVPKDLIKINLSTIEKENESILAANFKNHKKWHTYWINPGDAGLPIEVTFKLDGKEEKLAGLEWPKPKKYIEKGDIQTFGFENDYSLFYKLPKLNKTKSFSAHFKWLICKHICIPGEKRIEGSIGPQGLQISNNDFVVDKSIIELRLESLPKIKDIPPYLEINLIKYNEGLSLIYNIKGDQKEIRRNENILTPYPQVPFSFKRESLYKDKKGDIFAMYTADWDGEYLEPEIKLPSSGVFNNPYKLKFLFNDPIKNETYIIEKEFNDFTLNAQSNFESFFGILKKIENDDKPKTDKEVASSEALKESSSSSSSNTMIYFLTMAFLGGLLLNIMPCVLPVISIKLFGVIKHSGEGHKSIFKHNMAYTLGVLVTFMALATVVTILKSSGEQIGWGFQLQSPIFVAIMSAVIFIMSLNLFGLFEFRTPGGSKLGNVELRDTFKGDFLGGVLATILSTPCSAPFLGAALTFAFSESSATIFGIFTFIGLGLSAPFIMTAIFPSTVRFLPKPGMWMEHVKKFLGLTLILTTLWLLDVFSALIGSPLAVLKINTSLALLFFLIYMRSKITKNLILTLIFTISSLGLFAQAITTKQIAGSSDSAFLQDKQRSGLNWKKWSEEEMKNLQNNKQLTFIDFTAKWCITCKVNERLVLETDSFKDLVERKNITLLLGDWTKRDPVIGKWLMEHGFAGVPAYFVINQRGELIKLGETITLNEIEKALN